MEQISSLRSLLVDALGTGLEDGEQDLFEELTFCRAQLLKVFDVGPRSAVEQKEVESGRVEVDRRPLVVNADFARQVNFIARQLNCSERFCAGLLHSVLSESPTASEVSAVELAVIEYHRFRREIADCLRFLFEISNVALKGHAPPICSRINDFVNRYLVGKESMVAKLFTEIVVLDAAIANARIAVTNAISNTNIPSNQGGNANLGHNVLSATLESLTYERRTLAFALFFAARAGYLMSGTLVQSLDWLKNNPRHDMTPYILSAALASLDLSLSFNGSMSENLRLALAKDPNFVADVNKQLRPTAEWKDPSLKATVQLKWTLFLTEARFRDQSLEQRAGFKNEDLEMQVFNAVQGDTFTFLLRLVSQFGSTRSTASRLLENSTSENPDAKLSVVDEFRIYLLREVEYLVRSLLTHAPAELRKVKHKQEDQFRPRADHRQVRASLRPSDVSSDQPPRNDISILFQLIGQLYLYLPEDSAIQFWGAIPSTDTPSYFEIAEAERGKLPSFLRWAVEVRESDLIISVFDMLSGLSTGVLCSECAYNFMATGTLDIVHGNSGMSGRYETAAAFTWGSIFGELESWAALGINNRSGHGAMPQLPIAPRDVLLGLAFLKVLTAVAKHSVQARIAIHSHPQYRAIGCLVSLIPLGVPLELKGAIFEALSAFCQPGGGMQGVEICKSVWGQMERLEVINVRGIGLASKGVEVELEEVEAVYKVYPATIPFLELLGTLMHTSKRIPLKNRVTEPEPINTIPDNLGQPYRSPGIAPFVAFVVDNVLEKLPQREFLDSTDSWKMAGFALCFVERCLASYDLESLPSLADEFSAKGPEVLAPLVHHPGFDILTRILSETPLRALIVSYVVDGSEELHRQQGDKRFANIIMRCLRIMDRVLDIQDIFLDQLAPAVSQIDGSFAGKLSQSFLSRIDQGLSLIQRSVPAIGSYVVHEGHPELIFLAIRVLAALSQSPSFQNISNLIERSAESTIILDGFVRLLEIEADDDVTASEEWIDLWTGAGAPDLDGEQELFGQAIRLGIVDLLLRGTKRSKSSSLSFLLLFGHSSGNTEIQDPHALGSRQFCLHVILQLLNSGVPRLHGKGKERERRHLNSTRPLFELQPMFAERLYKLVYQLCDHPQTSSSIMLYLRTREDFFARHLAIISTHAPVDERATFIEVVYSDGSRVATTCASLKSFLQLRSWVLDLVALELHVLTNKGQHQRVKELLDLLIGSSDQEQDAKDDWDEDTFRPFNDISQSRIRIIELFQSLEFEWYDSISVSPVDLQYYKGVDLQQCVRSDDNGCEVIDRTALFEILSGARRQLLRQGQITTSSHSTQLDSETRYILESCVVENNRREVQFALIAGYESWKRLAEVVLTKFFNRVPQDQREGILFDLLHVLPPAINVTTLPETSAILLSEILLLLITKLREERHQAALLSTGNISTSASLPVERMTMLLKQMVESILDKHRRELVRGNVYAALVNYLHLVFNPSGDLQPSVAHGGLSRTSTLDSTLSSSFTSSLALSVSTLSRAANGAGGSLELSCFQVLKDVMDRLISTISKDAIDGAEVWKTVAFTLLESLARFSRVDTKQQVLASLDRYGLLSNFVHGIRESDSSLQSVLKPDPDELNPLFVYEAKMSFLTRLAENRRGSERLIDCRILHVLAQVDFLDTRPEADDSFNDRDSFLPSAMSRYHQLLVPALQLVGVILATVGPKHATAQKQTLDFIYNHRDNFIIMLKQEGLLATLKGIEELDLIVSIAALVVPTINKADLFATNSGFGGIHNAVLAMSSRILGSTKWANAIQPSDESEQNDAGTRAHGVGVTESKFDVKVYDAVQKLRKSVLCYLSSASNIEDDSTMSVVLSPVLSGRRDDRTTGATAPLPSIKDACDALVNVCNDLSLTMEEITHIAAELEHRDHVRVDNLEELLGAVDAEALRRIDTSQRRALVCRLLEKSQNSKLLHVESVLHSLEMYLILIWRHTNYYMTEQGSPSRAQDLKAQPSHLRSSTMRLLVVPDTNVFQKEAAAILGRVLEKLDSVQLDEAMLGSKWRSTQSYIEIVTRRLRETISHGMDEGDA